MNLLKHSDVPHVLGLHLEHAAPIPHSERVPWIDVEIVITHGHAMKGYAGVIKDVLCNQRTASGLRVLVQITSLDPTAPFKRIPVDYDHVVEARYSYFGPVEQPLTILTYSRGVKLHHFACPKSGLFMPRNYGPPQSSPTTLTPTTLTPWPPVDRSDNMTPIPESCLSSSPAWDASSRTPQPNRYNSCASPSQSADPEYALLDPPGSCTSLTPPSHPVEHVLLDPRLVNVGMRVVADRGKYKAKELTAFIMSMEGRLSIRHKKYKTWENLSPEWVTPKYPNPKRENGLLIMIKGENFGKFARRIYHRFVGGEAIAILAFVDRVAGQDTLTGDQLEVDASHLCVCEESIEDRKQNDLLMQPLRDEARKTRAT